MHYTRIFDPKIQLILDDMHHYLMYKGFPYRSVSVVYNPGVLGLCCHFSHDVKDKVTQEVINAMKREQFEYVINQPSNA